MSWRTENWRLEALNLMAEQIRYDIDKQILEDLISINGIDTRTSFSKFINDIYVKEKEGITT